MPTSTRKTVLSFTGVQGIHELAAADNTSSPATVELITLSSGDNDISVPTAGTVPTAVTIVPPAGNGTAIKIKQDAPDTGIRIHNTDPTTIALHSTVTSFRLNAGATITGVRLYWS